MFAESNRACPKCGMPHSFEWNERQRTAWCISCGYFEYFSDYQDYNDAEDGGLFVED